MSRIALLDAIYVRRREPRHGSTVWNSLIGVLAQPGHDRPNAISLKNDFIVESAREPRPRDAETGVNGADEVTAHSLCRNP